MKIKSKKIDKKRRLFVVTLQIEEETDDIWNLYNLLSRGDIIKGLIKRKVVSNKSSDLTYAGNEKRTLKATIKIEKIEYDGENEVIRVHGTNS